MWREPLVLNGRHHDTVFLDGAGVVCVMEASNDFLPEFGDAIASGVGGSALLW